MNQIDRAVRKHMTPVQAQGALEEVLDSLTRLETLVSEMEQRKAVRDDALLRAFRELNATLEQEPYRSIIAQQFHKKREAKPATISTLEDLERALRGGSN